jgi:hypothetical protein
MDIKSSDVVATSIRSSPASLFLRAVGSELGDGQQVGLEYSIRLRAGAIQWHGRCACWSEGDRAREFCAIARCLQRLDAPDPIISAQRSTKGVHRQGLAIDATSETSELRLYLHGRKWISSWRWQVGGRSIRRLKYNFHRVRDMPAVTIQSLQAALIHPEVRYAFTSLLSVPLVARTSGVWLREEEGRLDRLCIAFPWCPNAETLPDLLELLDVFSPHGSSDARLRRLPVRHAALSVGRSTPMLTLYMSVRDYRGSWPVSEETLQERVLIGSETQQRVFRHYILPQLDLG